MSGGTAKLELQINYKGSVAVDATTSLSFSLSGVIVAHAAAALPLVEESAAATVSLTISPVNDAPTGVADAYNATEDTPLTVAAPGVIGNDTDPERSLCSDSRIPPHESLR